MPVTSKRKRRERRLRRQIGLLHQLSHSKHQLQQLKQIVDNLQTQSSAPKLMLLGLLAQHGGELEVTKGTLAQITEGGVPLNWVAEDKVDDPLTLVVRLVVGSPQQSAAGQAVTAQPPQAEVGPATTDDPPAASAEPEAAI